MDAEALVRPVVEGAGFELVEVAFDGTAAAASCGSPSTATAGSTSTRSRRSPRRSPGGSTSRTSASGRYELEVSSPGIERPLRTPAQFARAHRASR